MEKEKKEGEDIQDMAAGLLLRPWLPADTPRRFVMGTIFAAAVLGAVLGFRRG